MHGIDWLSGPDAAFAQARASGRPVFLYWGAQWCPPCNRTKADVFADPRFALLAPRLVALHIDGDADGAQQLGERFALRSYPTLVLFRPDGTEITRLPCELGAGRFFAMLELALDARGTAAQALDAVLSGQRTLSNDEWHMLACYSWDTDEGRLLASRELGLTLAALVAACPVPAARLRLCWHALQTRAISADVAAMLADARAVSAEADVVSNYALELVRAADGAGRVQLAGAFAGALALLENDPSLTLVDQLGALRNRVRMARFGAPGAGLEQHARARVADAVARPASAASRHVLINTAAGVLSDAGLLDEAEQLLVAELPASHAPFYFMHNLAAIAKKRGDVAAMLDWYEQAWTHAQGAATRLQWGVTCLLALLDNAPEDVVRIDRLAGQLCELVGALPDAAFQRNRSQLKKVDSKLVATGEQTSSLLQAVRQRLG